MAETLACGAEVLYDQLFSEDREAADAAREIKVCLASGEILQAALTCDRMLSLHPDNKLFEGLRLEVENRERQVRLEFVRRLTSELENVPDLDARINAIQKALNRYPEESQLSQLLRNATASRDFFNALIAEAHNLELSETYSGALRQWYLIRELFPAMQGLENEIHRVESLADSQRRMKRRAEFVEAIFRLSSTGDYARAVYQCINALSEYPNDGGILTLKQSIEEKAQHVTELQKLISGGLTFLQNHNVDAALECFAKARAFDQSNLQVRYLIGIALLEKTRVVMQDDRRKLNILLDEARGFISDHPELQTLSPAPDGLPPSDPSDNENWEKSLVRLEHPRAELQQPPAPDPSPPAEPTPTRKRWSFRRIALFSLVLLGTFSIGWLVYSNRPGSAGSLSASPVSLAENHAQPLPPETVSETKDLEVDLQPAFFDVHIVSDQPGGIAWMDDQNKGDITESGLTISGVESGVRILKVLTPSGEIEISFEFSPGKMPAPKSLPTRQIANVLFVGSADGKAHAECNCAPAGLRVGDLAELIRAGGLDVPLVEGPHRAELWLGKNRRDLTIHGGAAPVATIAVFEPITR